MPHVYRKIADYPPEEREARRAHLNRRKRANRARRSPELTAAIRERDAEAARKRRAERRKDPEAHAAALAADAARKRDQRQRDKRLQALARRRHPDLF